SQTLLSPPILSPHSRRLDLPPRSPRPYPRHWPPLHHLRRGPSLRLFLSQFLRLHGCSRPFLVPLGRRAVLPRLASYSLACRSGTLPLDRSLWRHRLRSV